MRNIISKFLFTLLVLTMGIGQMWGTDYTIYQATSSGVNTANKTETGISVTFNSFKAVSNSPVTTVADATYGIEAGLKAPRWGGGGDGKNIKVTVSDNYTATITVYVQTSAADKTVSIKSGSESGTEIASVNCAAIETVYRVQASDLAAGDYYIKAGNDKVGLIKLVATVTATGGGDTEAPTFVSSVPANTATNQETSGTIVLTFSEDIANIDDSKFSLSGATIGTVAIDGTDATKVNVPYTGAANEATVTLSVAAGAVEDAAGNALAAALSDISFTTEAAVTPVCPSGLTISGTAAYTEGEPIELTAALEAGNGTINYQWYKGSIALGNEIGMNSNVLTIASCTTSDAGDYFCVASKDACSDAESTAFAVTVAEKVCPTSGEVFAVNLKSGASTRSLNAGVSYDLTSSDADMNGGTVSIKNIDTSNGKMQIANSSGKKFYFNGAKAYLRIDLDCPLEEGDVINIKGGSGKQIAITPTEGAPQSQTLKRVTSSYSYTITAADVTAGFVGSSIKTYYLGRDENSATYATGVEILRPYNISFSSAKGTAPDATKGFEVTLEQITGVEGWVHTGWTANAAVKVGSTDVALGDNIDVDATVTVSSDVTFTAVWAEDIPAVDPEITFSNGAYTIGGAALDLSTLFTSNNTSGAVTYAIKNANGTEAAIDGVNFTATVAGEAVVTATQAASVGFNQKAVDATITVSAPSEVDGIKMVVDGDLTGNFRTTASLSNQERTIAGIAYTKYIGLSSRSSWGSQPSGPDNYLLQYTLTKKTNTFYFYAYNKNSGGKSIKVYVKEEGENVVTKTIDIPGSKGDLFSCEVNVNKNAEVCISHTSTDVQICQVVVVESGDALLQAPAVDYNINFNKGRLTAKQNTAKTYEGLTYCNNADYKIDNSTSLKLTTRGTHYVSFEIPAGQTRQLQVTTGGSSYNVSKVLGDNEKATVSGNNNFNLGAGVWYINPQGSDVTITNIKFIAAPASMTISFNSDGGSDVDAQVLFAGDKVTEPTTPTKDGYRFVKWQKSGADYDFDYELVAGDAPGFTLDAVWQETVTVTFDPNNGESTFTRTPDKGAKIAAGDIPADPTYAGYDFQGWTEDLTAEPIVHVDLSTQTFSTATTLKAHWEVAQDDATLSALSYNGNAIDVNSAVEEAGVQTYHVLLPWMVTPTVDPALISFTKNAETATVSTALAYNDGTKTATFAITSGNGSVTVNYAIVFAFDAKRGTSIIKATTGNVVTGLIGGTINQSYSGTAASRKLNKNDYFGIQLAEGNFQEGDVLIINITTAADLGNFMVYADAARTELIADQGITYTKPDAASPVICPTGEMRLELPAAVNGHNTLYLSRENGNTQWNVTFSYLEVTRLMNPAIKSFKFGENAATIDEEHKTISIDVPYLTDVTALTPTVEAYGNNGATYTPAGATDFTSSVDYVVTDGYSEFNTTYAVTVNVAAPSENANLASLAVAGYTLDFDPAVVTYNVVLDYGTTVLPTITYEVEEVGLATADKVEDGVNGATTITVTPQAGVGYEKVYTINFSVNTTPKYVIYDGSTGMTAFTATSFEDDDTHFAWAIGSGITPSADNVPNTTTYSNVWGGKTYTKMLKSFKPQDSNTTQLTITVPENYLAKIRLVGTTNSNESMRKMFVSKEASRNAENALDGYIIESDSYNASGFVTNYLLPGVYYIGSTDACRLYELSVTLTPIDYSRTTTEGRYGTICLPKAGVMVGAELYEVAYLDNSDPYQKIFLDEVPNGEMVAGRPYVFLPKVGETQLGVFYTGTDEVTTAGNYNGLYGSYTKEELPTDGSCYILLNNQYRQVVESPTYVGANKAYFKVGVTGGVPTTAIAPKPGIKRVGLGVAAPQTPTDIDNLNATDAPVKVMINGQMYILRGEKMYNANGQLVK